MSLRHKEFLSHLSRVDDGDSHQQLAIDFWTFNLINFINQLVPGGKHLVIDFLIQELHREANTMGSKSAALELTKVSVDMKVLIEQMREQVQNIE